MCLGDVRAREVALVHAIAFHIFLFSLVGIRASTQKVSILLEQATFIHIAWRQCCTTVASNKPGMKSQ